MSFVLPATFAPTYQKNFSHKGVNYVIKIQDMGVQPQTPGQAPHLLWHYAIYVGIAHKLVETGPFRWDVSDRTLTMENVANNLATFYGDSIWVQEAKPSRENLQEVPDLDQIIYKCAAFMFQELITEMGRPDYDIIVAEHNESGWRVILSTPLMPERLHEFSFIPDRHSLLDKPVRINTYIKAHGFIAQI